MPSNLHRRNVIVGNCATKSRSLLVGALSILAASCSDWSRPVGLEEGAPVETFALGSSARSDLITADPRAFADALRRIANENEILVVLKDAHIPRIAADFLRSLPLSSDLVIGLPESPGAAPHRHQAGSVPAGSMARTAVREALTAHGAIPYRDDERGTVLMVRIPDPALVSVLAALLHHPNVDYIEANQQRPVYLDAGPLGSNPLDLKHTFHNVDDAWAYTRGAGVKVGVLDTGLGFNRSTGQWHEDALLLTSAKGIDSKGFVDDYDALNNCDATGGQPYGDCVLWDDGANVPRGSWMTGLVGANDNGLGYVGVMPEGLTVSMKVIQNGDVSGFDMCQGYGPTYECLEDDDFYWGVKWAGYNGVKVLSMSFSGDWGSTVYNALYDAYYTHDILLLSSTGNSASQPREPQSFGFVMGVGGLDQFGNSVFNDEYEEISALSGGSTINASCSGYDFCVPSGYHSFSIPAGGTSASTAIAAGIAGLVRAHDPTLTAP